MDLTNENIFAELVKNSAYNHKELAGKLDISLASMYNYLSGKRKPDIRIMFDLSNIVKFPFKLSGYCDFDLDNLEILDSVKSQLEVAYIRFAISNKELAINNFSLCTDSNKKFVSDSLSLYMETQKRAINLGQNINETSAELSALRDENAKLRGQIELLKELLADKK